VGWAVDFAEIDPQELQKIEKTGSEERGGENWAKCSLGSRTGSCIVRV
jgi:hypothetical protein